MRIECKDERKERESKTPMPMRCDDTREPMAGVRWKECENIERWWIVHEKVKEDGGNEWTFQTARDEEGEDIGRWGNYEWEVKQDGGNKWTFSDG
jgi:hypothetical protein